MNRAAVPTLIAALLIGCSASADPIETIAGLNDGALPAGTYRVVGYLVFLDDCGFCPPGALCEPCAGPAFSVLADGQEPGIEWSGSTQEVVEQLGTDHLVLSINLDTEDRLEQGVRYEVTIELTDSTPYGGSNRLATLLEFSEQR
jgi:hypothetical protein